MSDPSDADRKYILRLFVSGQTPRSTRAIANLRNVLEAELPGQYHLEVIDLYKSPEAARTNQIIAAPTLVKLFPEPVRRIIGDLSNVERVLRGLDIEPKPDAMGDDDEQAGQ